MVDLFNKLNDLYIPKKLMINDYVD